MSSVATWDGSGAVLADTSAWMIARRSAQARKRLLDAIARGDLAWCWPVRYELLVDARDPQHLLAVDRSLEGLREIAVDRSVQRACFRRCASLRTAARMAHRIPLADLTVAVAARTAGLKVQHFDRHFERLG